MVISTSDTVITPTSGGSLTDLTGTVYTMNTAEGGSILANGVIVPGGGDTAELTIVNGEIWALASAASSPPNVATRNARVVA